MHYTIIAANISCVIVHIFNGNNMHWLPLMLTLVVLGIAPGIVHSSRFVKSFELSVHEGKKEASITCNLGNFKEDHVLVITKHQVYCPENVNGTLDKTNVPIICLGSSSFRFAEVIVWNETLTKPYLVERDIDIKSILYQAEADVIFEVSINDVKPSDAGNYTCRVLIDNHNGSFNSEDKGLSKILSIDDVKLTLPRCSTNATTDPNLGLDDGTSVILSCTSFGASKLQFNWSRSDGALISTANPAFDLGHGADDTVLVHSSVVIVLGDSDDGVIFKCTTMNASNPTGTCDIGPFKIKPVDNPWIVCTPVLITTSALLLLSICINVVLTVRRFKHQPPLIDQSYVVPDHHNETNLGTRLDNTSSQTPEREYDDPAPDLPTDTSYYGHSNICIASTNSRVPLTPLPRSDITSNRWGMSPPRGGVPIFH